MGECRISDSPGDVLSTFALGSCIGLALYDPAACIGGLLHFMLPTSSLDPPGARLKPFRFADTGIRSLVDGLISRGASKKRLTVCAAGGAAMSLGSDLFDIGKRNEQAMRDVLRELELPLHAAATGGGHFRSLKLEIGTGCLWLVEGGAQKRLLERRPSTRYTRNGSDK